ncbi:MAG: Druantia anti-phage system protein DruA [Candidatus Rifleibacteriota bacterium]
MIVQCGRRIKEDEVKQICETVKTFSNLSRQELAHTICEHLGWYTASGKHKLDACQKLLHRMETQDLILLPKKNKISPAKSSKKRQPVINNRTRPQKEVVGKLSDIEPVVIRVAQNKEEVSLVNEYLYRYHYLGYKRPFGCHLRYLIEVQGEILGCILFSGAARALAPRDQWIGWSTNERLRNLGFVVNNDRFLIFPWVKVRYLASHVLGKIVRGLAQDWEQYWEYRPALLETFVDPQYFDGTCYRAANFRFLGMTKGMGLVRPGKNYTTSPKKIFVYPLVANFRQILFSQETIGKEVL